MITLLRGSSLLRRPIRLLARIGSEFLLGLFKVPQDLLHDLLSRIRVGSLVFRAFAFLRGGPNYVTSLLHHEPHADPSLTPYLLRAPPPLPSTPPSSLPPRFPFPHRST